MPKDEKMTFSDWLARVNRVSAPASEPPLLSRDGGQRRPHPGVPETSLQPLGSPSFLGSPSVGLPLRGLSAMGDRNRQFPFINPVQENPASSDSVRALAAAADTTFGLDRSLGTPQSITVPDETKDAVALKELGQVGLAGIIKRIEDIEKRVSKKAPATKKERRAAGLKK